MLMKEHWCPQKPSKTKRSITRTRLGNKQEIRKLTPYNLYKTAIKHKNRNNTSLYTSDKNKSYTKRQKDLITLVDSDKNSSHS